jgi:hypothetical protein
LPSILAIDPGLRCLGAAVFVSGKLERAFLARSPEKVKRGPGAWMDMAKSVLATVTNNGRVPVMFDQIVSEYPQVYRMSRNPGDLIELTGVVGAVMGLIPAHKHVGYLPREWKGSCPGDVFVERIETRLDADDVARIEPCPKSLRHNVIDAVGLGLHHLGLLR